MAHVVRAGGLVGTVRGAGLFNTFYYGVIGYV
jgi:hypothetical protein